MSRLYWLIIILGVIIAINLYSSTCSSHKIVEGAGDTCTYATEQCERAQTIIDDANTELNKYKSKVSALVKQVAGNKKAVKGLQKQIKTCMKKNNDDAKCKSQN